MCVSVSHNGEEIESIAVKEISYREKLYPRAVRRHTSARTHTNAHAHMSIRMMKYFLGLDIWPGNKT